MLGLATQAKDFTELIISQPVKSAAEVNEEVQMTARKIIKTKRRYENSRIFIMKDATSPSGKIYAREVDVHVDTTVLSPNGSTRLLRGEFVRKDTLTHPEDMFKDP